MTARLKVMLQSRFIYLLMFLLVASSYVFLILNVRPIADDYCAGATSVQGVLKYVVDITQTWGGDYSQIALNGLLVGYPIANWPLFLIGFPSLALSLLLLVAVFFKLYSRLAVDGTESWIKKDALAISSIVLIFWNLFWSLPASLDFGYHLNAFAMADKSFAGVFGWSTVIVQYIVVPFLIALGFLMSGQQSKGRFFQILTIGLFSGMAGYALAFSFGITVVLLQVSRRLRLSLSHFLVLEISLAVGVLVSLLSPGSRARSAILLAEDSASSQISFARWMFISALEFFASIFNFGNFLVLIATFLVFFFFGIKAVLAVDQVKLVKYLSVLGIFLSIYYGVISFSEYLTYEAFWHLLTYRSGLFFFWFMMGILLAKAVLARKPNLTHPVRKVWASGTLSLILISAVAISLDANSSILNRGIIWKSNAAPLPGIGDIEPRKGWVDLCWQRLKEARNLQNR